MSHAARARTALAQLAEIDPALGALALWCRHRDDDGETRTVGDTIQYGPGFEMLPLPQQVGLAAHHVLHVALRHPDRAAGMAERLGPVFSSELFGLAADAIVNDTLIAAGHALPRPCPRLVELLERIGEPAASALSALADWDTERLALRLHRDDRSRNAARDYGKAKKFVPDLSEGEDGPSQDDASDWRGHMLRAMEAGRQAGTGIGLLGGVIADIAQPRIPWERQLRGLLARALMEEPRQTWRRPSGRWAAMDADARARGGAEPVFQPGRQRSTWRPRIVVGIDTSSSIDALTLRLFVAEAEGIARRTGAETHLLAFDTQIHHEERLRPGQRLLLEGLSLRTGGGTDFRAALARAAQLAPSIVVLLTDLDGPVGTAPRSPVLWVVQDGAPEAPFGRVLRIPD